MTGRYYTYQTMWDELLRLQGAYPEFVTVEVIGKSRQGRDIAGVTLTHRKTGPAHMKSAVFVDANIHAGEVAGNAVAMFWMQWCLANYGKDSDATELLDSHTVYIVPRVAVDGAELYMTTPARFRSSPHSYPYSDPPEGYVQEDVNGDGHILYMRVPAEDGGFVMDDIDSRIMRARGPGEMGGKYYHVFPEGRIDRTSKSGPLPAMVQAKDARRWSMDFNRNFPIRWAGESEQPGSGPYPLSEPELRSLADFIQTHPNIAAYVALHTSGGVILRQPSTGDDTVLSTTDRLLFTRIAEMGAHISGYHSASNYQTFATGHEKVLMPGAADDWMYDHLGVLSFTLEIWDLNRRAGARGYGELGMRRMMELTPDEVAEDDRKIWAWADKEVGDRGVFNWTPFHHPDFGAVEIGGLDEKFILQNPPRHLIEEECKNVGLFLTKLGLSTPKLTIPSVSAAEEGEGLYRVVAEVANAGFLPTSSTEKGKKLLLEGIRATINGSVEVIAGMSPTELNHLDGYGGQSTWSPPSSQRKHVEWVVKAQPGTTATVKFEGHRAGSVSKSVILGQARRSDR